MPWATCCKLVACVSQGTCSGTDGSGGSAGVVIGDLLREMRDHLRMIPRLRLTVGDFVGGGNVMADAS